MENLILRLLLALSGCLFGFLAGILLLVWVPTWPPTPYPLFTTIGGGIAGLCMPLHWLTGPEVY